MEILNYLTKKLSSERVTLVDGSMGGCAYQICDKNLSSQVSSSFEGLELLYDMI